MRELPSGTVTLLFTDIEGSTRLLHELGDQYADALAEHRRILRETFSAHGGAEVDTQGDAFFVAFPTAPEAVRAAAQAVKELSSGPIQVRIGIHTGTPHVGEEGYVGVDVVRAARIAAAGHGGQVLVSASTAALLDSVELRDIGEHRLKDLTQPQRLYQLVIPELETEFPALKTLENSPTNLPTQPTPLIGREEELAQTAEPSPQRRDQAPHTYGRRRNRQDEARLAAWCRSARGVPRRRLRRRFRGDPRPGACRPDNRADPGRS